MFASMTLSGTGLTAERLRLNLLANNLANINTPGYKSEQAVFQARPQGGVAVTAVVQSARPRVLSTNGTKGSNVNPVRQMVNLLSATRGYEANISAYTDEKLITQRLTRLL